MTTFITNGLLGFHKENDKAQDISPDISFSLNGLLGSSSSDETMNAGFETLSGANIHLTSS
jgi:hypothetical protein